MKNIAVIGVGTGGIISISHLLGFLPPEWNITSIFDPTIPILGIGETAGPAVLPSLYKGCGFGYQDFSKLDATPKYGSHFINWRKDEIKLDVMPPEIGMHFNNFALKEYALPRFKEIHGDRFSEIHGVVSEIKNYNDHAVVVVNDKLNSFDWVIDCRGYPEDYTDYVESEVTPVNHCLVNIINEPGEWRFTKHVATEHGWMFGVPLSTRQGWGYLYNDKLTSKEEATENIKKIFNNDNLNLKEFKFKNYYCKNVVEGRIIKNGNRAMFFEPMDALAGLYYTVVNRYLFDIIMFNKPTYIANEALLTLAQDIETFIAFIYHGGSNFNSKFWNETVKNTSNYLKNSKRFQTYLEKLNNVQLYELVGVHYPDTWKMFDKVFNYSYTSR